MRDVLIGYALALGEGAGESEAAVVVRELEAVAALLVHHEDLRLVLTDPGIDERTRRSVIRDLLEGKARSLTVDLLSFAVRVERAAELPVTVGQLALRLSGDDLPKAMAESPPSRTAGRDQLRGYAERVFQDLSSASAIDEVEDELFRIGRMLHDYPELRTTLSDPQLALVDRCAIFDDLLARKVTPASLRLARATVCFGQQRDLVGAFAWLTELTAEERGLRLAEVRSAVEVSADEIDRLAAALGRIVERPVEVRVILDPGVLGGALVTVGDLIIDGTVRLRLERLREALAPSA